MKTWQPLAGIKVLSFELAFALPAGTRALHDLGADVVRVSPPARQVDRYVGFIDGVFQGKSCISLDLTKPEGRDVAARLAAEADVVCSNFRPHVLAKYGLGADVLRERHPRLITLQLSGYGTPGPWSNYPAFGPSTEAAGGLNRLLVNEGEVPVRIGSAVFSDQLAGRYAALAVIGALEQRRRTGEGQKLDLSMTAAITHMLGQSMTEAWRLGETPQSFGNRDQRFVPQGVYRCAPAASAANSSAVTDDNGAPADQWLAISVASDKQWRALCGVLGEDLLSAHELNVTMTAAQRWHLHDAIDAALDEYCGSSTKDELANQLQQLGVPAAPVRTTADQATDPNIAARGSLQMVRHKQPVLGYSAHPHPVLPWRLVGKSRRRLGDYRHTGVDNAAVLKRWLGASKAEIQALKAAGVLYAEAELEIKPRRRSRSYDPDHAAKLGLPR